MRIAAFAFAALLAIARPAKAGDFDLAFSVARDLTISAACETPETARVKRQLRLFNRFMNVSNDPTTARALVLGHMDAELELAKSGRAELCAKHGERMARGD